jgi:hypothetical protein
VSSKALLMFQEEGGWRPADLLRLSALLLPAHLLLCPHLLSAITLAATITFWLGK